MSSGRISENRAELFSSRKIPTWKIILLGFKMFPVTSAALFVCILFIYFSYLTTRCHLRAHTGPLSNKNRLLHVLFYNFFHRLFYFEMWWVRCSGFTSANCGPTLIAFTCTGPPCPTASCLLPCWLFFFLLEYAGLLLSVLDLCVSATFYF